MTTCRRVLGKVFVLAWPFFTCTSVFRMFEKERGEAIKATGCSRNAVIE
jgi:hypothetical protein